MPPYPEKLQLDAELTLDKAVTRVCQAEEVKKQQSVLRGEGAVKPDITVGAIQRGKPKKGNPQIGPRQKGGVTAHKHPPTGTVCSRCGKSPAHNCQRCPARDTTCHKCGKQGHITRWCVSLPKWVWFRRMRPICITLMMLSLEHWERKVRNPGQ